MSVGFVAYHYPAPAEFDEFVTRARFAADVVGATTGCVATDCLVSIDGSAVVTVAVWTTHEAQRASLESASDAGVDFSFDAREIRPRSIVRFD